MLGNRNVSLINYFLLMASLGTFTLSGLTPANIIQASAEGPEVTSTAKQNPTSIALSVNPEEIEAYLQAILAGQHQVINLAQETTAATSWRVYAQRLKNALNPYNPHSIVRARAEQRIIIAIICLLAPHPLSNGISISSEVIRSLIELTERVTLQSYQKQKEYIQCCFTIVSRVLFVYNISTWIHQKWLMKQAAEATRQATQNACQTLGISPCSELTPETIKASCKAALKKVHPDKVLAVDLKQNARATWHNVTRACEFLKQAIKPEGTFHEQIV